MRRRPDSIDPAATKFNRLKPVLLDRYCTVSVTLVVSDAFPEAVVTVIEYVPAGVPVAGLSAGL